MYNYCSWLRDTNGLEVPYEHIHAEFGLLRHSHQEVDTLLAYNGWRFALGHGQRNVYEAIRHMQLKLGASYAMQQRAGVAN